MMTLGKTTAPDTQSIGVESGLDRLLKNFRSLTILANGLSFKVSAAGRYLGREGFAPGVQATANDLWQALSQAIAQAALDIDTSIEADLEKIRSLLRGGDQSQLTFTSHSNGGVEVWYLDSVYGKSGALLNVHDLSTLHRTAMEALDHIATMKQLHS